MVIEFTKFIAAVSRATDFVESELVNLPPYHEKRVAILANAMARHMGMDGDAVYALTMAGALHDCALAEYLNDELSETDHNFSEMNMASHCIAGEEMLLALPFYQKVHGAVLHHHERADGRGAFGLKTEDTSIFGQILHIADMADIVFSLNTMDQEKFRKLAEWTEEGSGSLFSAECGRYFTGAVSYQLLRSITGEGCVEVFETLAPCVQMDVPMDVMRKLAAFFAHITDYKSHFTWHHSLGIAEKAERMGVFYGYPQETRDKLYIAGALHDVGKLLIHNDILEKPGRLTTEEYSVIQNHAMGTWNLLHDIGGMEDITRWASLHHEKLDGSGYPFGYKAEQLGKNERLMACLDIYQALVEERPYKAGLAHDEAMAILNKMGSAGQLDRQILRDIDQCHALKRTAAAKARDAKAAPKTYAGEAWRCPVCGNVYEGALPEDFICPICEQPGTIFERV